MPIFEYICQDCQDRFERLFLNRQESREVVCSSCGSRKVKRIFSTFGLGGGKSSSGSTDASCSTCSGKTCSTCR